MTSRKRIIGMIAATAALGMVAGCSGGTAEGDATTLRLGMVAADGSVQHQAAERFAESVAESSGGELEVEVFPAGQIGSDESLGQDLSSGALDFAFLNQGSMAATDPLLDFHYLPYIVTNYAQADELFYGDGIIPQTMTETLAAHGIRALGWYELEFRGASTSDGPIQEPADLAGQKIRVPGSAAIGAFFEETGAQPTTIPFPELYSALQQGTVDGQDNGLLITYDNRFFEINDHYTLTRHVYASGTIAASESIWETLSDEETGWIEDAAADAQEWEIAEERAVTDEYIQLMTDEGVEVTELDDSELAEFQAAGRAVWDDMADVYGEDRIAALREEVEAVADLK
ncbi:TRAP transporter substrate-binding protein [Microbacterium sp. JB110]|uniref:TRAP transporter substrate-binding protein n=1 Tax=Microbacterium sp. JB110 TaxID=2024477 RepID=UPI000B362ADC|nr:TRAP transporter substrate-binding protein [Microbacterium sp. JB110]RCS60786.1 TRAP transporter substrate-binding protein [Microbacterium sp. JB110]